MDGIACLGTDLENALVRSEALERKAGQRLNSGCVVLSITSFTCSSHHPERGAGLLISRAFN